MILVADDSTFMRTWLKRILHEGGYTNIIEACNGLEAIQKYQALKPNIIILDITMPDINGLTALKKIIEINPQAKVIMCSAMATNANTIEAMNAGASDFIVKPFFDDLNKVIERILKTEVHFI